MQNIVNLVMSVTSVMSDNKSAVNIAASRCVDQLLEEAFTWAKNNDQLWTLNNLLLVGLGLIKVKKLYTTYRNSIKLLKKCSFQERG